MALIKISGVPLPKINRHHVAPLITTTASHIIYELGSLMIRTEVGDDWDEAKLVAMVTDDLTFNLEWFEESARAMGGKNLADSMLPQAIKTATELL